MPQSATPYSTYVGTSMSFTNRKRRPSTGTTSLRPSLPGKGRPSPRKSASEPASSLPFERATVRLTGRLRRRSGPARRPSDERGRGPGLRRGRDPAPPPPGEGPRRGGREREGPSGFLEHRGLARQLGQAHDGPGRLRGDLAALEHLANPARVLALDALPQGLEGIGAQARAGEQPGEHADVADREDP